MTGASIIVATGATVAYGGAQGRRFPQDKLLSDLSERATDPARSDLTRDPDRGELLAPAPRLILGSDPCPIPQNGPMGPIGPMGLGRSADALSPESA
jgi:hypothetical protein